MEIEEITKLKEKKEKKGEEKKCLKSPGLHREPQITATISTEPRQLRHSTGRVLSKVASGDHKRRLENAGLPPRG